MYVFGGVWESGREKSSTPSVTSTTRTVWSKQKRADSRGSSVLRSHTQVHAISAAAAAAAAAALFKRTDNAHLETSIFH